MLADIQTRIISMSRKIGPTGLIALCIGYVLNDIVGAVLSPTDYEVVRELVRDTQFRSAVTEISENVVISTVSDDRFFSVRMTIFVTPFLILRWAHWKKPLKLMSLKMQSRALFTVAALTVN